MKESLSVFWFRRDLRLSDNHGLFRALESGYPVLPIFIFDREILSNLPQDDARVTFIHQSLSAIRKTLSEDYGSSLAVYHGSPEEVFARLLGTFNIKGVYTNKDYEPYALERDRSIAGLAKRQGIEFHSFKDQVIFEQNEVVKDNGDPYVVYTPYKNSWKVKFNADKDLLEYASDTKLDKLHKGVDLPWCSLSDLGFKPSSKVIPSFDLSDQLIGNYEATRNFPSKKAGTSRLGPHLRFGTVSIRRVVQRAIGQKNETYWHELIWREFFMQILWHFPYTVNHAFKPKYDRIEWRNDPDEFERWKNGETGYPLVDAGMRELNTTGYMHNRVRMLVASFLCKHLLIDWRWGEAYFAEKLLDFELSSNVGNWQWAAGSGVDAAPYFRIFNPYTQADKFDKDRSYISRWVPEYQDETYASPIVDHKFARERCLEVFKQALN